MNTQIAIESIIYYLEINSIKSLSLTSKTLHEVAKEYVNTFFCITKKKKDSINLITTKWVIIHHKHAHSILTVSSTNIVKYLDYNLQNNKIKIIDKSFITSMAHWASIEGYEDVLDWLLKTSIKFKVDFEYTYNLANSASNNGHIHILNWLLKTSIERQIELKYTSTSINSAIIKNHIHVLEWWLKTTTEHNLQFKCTKIVQTKDNYQCINLINTYQLSH